MATDITNLDHVSAADLCLYQWRDFTGDTLLEAARAAYIVRYGEPPAHITRTLGGILLAARSRWPA